jgi:two-component system, LytTR family, sensor kinase
MIIVASAAPSFQPAVTPMHFFLATMVLQAARSSVWSESEIVMGAARISTGLALLLVVWQLAHRLPWPRPFRPGFALTHLAAAPVFAFTWLLLSKSLGALVTSGRIPLDGERWEEYLTIGIVFYLFVSGTAYAVEAMRRAARAEALAARTQLAALRAQLHPHFLFNALHTIVQLIPAQPARATEAAELVADLLRTAVDEQRDEVTLEDEWRFVSRYLAVEQIRFGDRLAIRSGIAAELLEERVPSFALQTLVENAVRHGAAPRVAPTEIVVSAVGGAADLTLTVRNSGDRAPATNGTGAGTGLARLRERLAVLYGGASRLVCRPLEEGGFEAMLTVPRPGGRAA